MKRNNILCSIMFLSAAVSASAITDIDALVRQVAANNLSLASVQAQANAEMAQLKSENQLPDPEADFTHLWGQKNIGTKWGIGISQSFEWPGVYKARKKHADTTQEALNYLTESSKLDLLLQIKLTMIDIINAKKLVDLYQSQMLYVDSLYTVYQRGVAQGEISRLDLNKLKIERIGTSRKLNDAINSLNDSETKLRQFNGGKPSDDIVSQLIDYPEILILPLDNYIDMASAHNPQMRYNSLMARSLTEQGAAAKLSRMPGFSIGYNHEYEMGERFNGFTIGITLPVYSRKSKVAASLLASESYRDNNIQLQVEMIAEIASIRTQAVNLRSEIEQYRPIFDEDDNMRLLKKAFSSGHITLISYFLEVNYFLDAYADYLALHHQYNIDMARLNRYLLLND